MTALLAEFESRVAEIETYFSFLRDLLERDALLHFPRGRRRKTATCSEELLKILKANAFLLLYNLAESSIRAGVTSIYDAVRTERLPYSGVCNELRALWTLQQFVFDDGRKPENNAKRLVELIDSVLAAETMSLEARDLPISGNVDADQIRILAQKYGFRVRAPERLKGGVLLKRVKEERNSLAHGHKSFTESGRDLTYETLVQIQRQVVPYLRHVLRGVDKFVTQRGYVFRSTGG